MHVRKFSKAKGKKKKVKGLEDQLKELFPPTSLGNLPDTWGIRVFLKKGFHTEGLASVISNNQPDRE